MISYLQGFPVSAGWRQGGYQPPFVLAPSRRRSTSSTGCGHVYSTTAHVRNSRGGCDVTHNARHPDPPPWRILDAYASQGADIHLHLFPVWAGSIFSKSRGDASDATPHLDGTKERKEMHLGSFRALAIVSKD